MLLLVGAILPGMTGVNGRLQLIWDSPITAGAFIAVLLPWILWPTWEYTKNRGQNLGWTVASALAGLGGIICLTLTQSRGPMLAFGVGCTSACLLARRLLPRHTGQIQLRGALALLLLGLLVWQTKAGGRVTIEAMANDDSIHNRLHIWQAGLDMLHLAPLHGLGYGQGGDFYSQWYEPDTINYFYTTLFNSYLEIGVELGLPALAALLIPLGFFWIYPWFCHLSSPRHEGLHVAGVLAHASLTVILAVNLTSAHWQNRSLAFCLIACLGVLTAFIAAMRANCPPRRWLLCAITLGCGVPGLLYAARLILPPPPFTFALARDRTISVRKESTASGATSTAALFLADRTVLGTNYGKTIRQILRDSDNFQIFLVPDPRYRFYPNFSPTSTVIATGSTVRLLADAPAGQLLILHPSLPAPVLPPDTPVKIWLPSYDLPGVAIFWQQSAQLHHWQIIHTEARGQDLGQAVRLKL